LCRLAAAALLAAGAFPLSAMAQFSLAISPPRFELNAKPGQKLQEVLELSNTAPQATILNVKTADWKFLADDSVVFEDELAKDSCRPWVAIERRQFIVPVGRPYRYRFEIEVPADAKPQECRWALQFYGLDQTAKSGDVTIPIGAQIGIIVYLAVGEVLPELSVEASRIEMVNGTPMPVLLVHNTGTAHGRLGGFLSGKDASGATLDFSPASTPVMPGETRRVILTATKSSDPYTAVPVQFPVTIKGNLEWGSNRKTPIEQIFAR
jgi:hypothetical protein